MRREDLKFGLDSLVDVAFIYMNRPGIGKNCERSHRRKDGRLKRKLTRYEANEEIVSFANEKNDFMRPYQCPVCGSYHVGHSEKMSFYEYLKNGGIDSIIDIVSGVRAAFR